MVRIDQQTDYPTSGDVILKVDPSNPATFEVKLRIPRWCKNATVSVNGSKGENVAGGQFHAVAREWKAGDRIELKMPMSCSIFCTIQCQPARLPNFSDSSSAQMTNVRFGVESCLCWSCMAFGSLQWNDREEEICAVPAIAIRVRVR